MKSATLLAASLLTAAAVNAADPVDLSFSRTGTTAADVTVTVAGATGATAQVSALSHALKSLTNAAIICPDVNGNTSPTINISLTVAGLPADFKFNTVGLHVWALNAAGATQQTNDNKNRHFNVSIAANNDNIASFTDLDPAAGVTGANKLWTVSTTNDVTAGNPLTLDITITKGTDNQGCFFGLEHVQLSYVEPEGPVDPVDPVDPTGTKTYTVKWKNNSQLYMAQGNNNAVVAMGYGVTNRIFWDFIPTENPNCYYIRNSVSGKYLGSCNKTASSASTISVGDTPVEYYVGSTTATSGDNAGCVWLSSTDCSVYNVEGDNTRALNKDGASSNVITWIAKPANVGSYWKLTESENLYEIRPFTPSAAIGTPLAEYYIVNAEGKVYTPAGTWEPKNAIDRAQRWYFVGNAAAGYQIVAVSNNTPLNGGTAYKLTATAGEAPYSFIAPDGSTLLGNITFAAGRSAFALACQIYQIPCGSTGSCWIEQLTAGDLRYPMGRKVGKTIVYDKASRPANKYVILSRDAATVNRSSACPLSIELNAAPADNVKLILCLDWDRDGYFEHTEELECAKSITSAINVPADAATGKVRARLRLTENGLTGPDDDVVGEVLDIMLDVTDPLDEAIDPVVKVNDPLRGTAEWADGIASARPLGNALHLYWLDGARLASVEAEYAVASSPNPRTLTAVFSANTNPLSGIDSATLAKTDSDARIVFDGKTVSVENAAEVKGIMLFTVSAARAAATAGNNLATDALAEGIYIVKAITDKGVASAKIRI